MVPAIALAWLALAATAGAELVYLTTGQALSVRGHRIEGGSVVLALRGGGEIVCDAGLVARIAPDEIQYPDPPAPALLTAPSFAQATVPYSAIIDRASARHRVDPSLVRAVIQVESAYRTAARSRKGAMGLMQLMPETASRYNVRDPYDPESNIVAGIQHLRRLLDRFDVSLALAAYNAGEAAVLRFQAVPPFAETQEYVRRVLSLTAVSLPH